MALLSVVRGVKGVLMYFKYIVDYSLYSLDTRKPPKLPKHIYKPTPQTDFLTPQTGSEICSLYSLRSLNFCGGERWIDFMQKEKNIG